MFRVTSYRDGKAYSMEFSNGKMVKPFSESKSSKPKKFTGSLIEFILNPVYFKDTDTVTIPLEWLTEALLDRSYLNPNVEFNLTYDGESSQFFSENGILDLVDDVRSKKSVIGEVLSFSDSHTIKDTEIEVDIAFDYQVSSDVNIFAFCNSICQTEGGTHTTGLKQAIGTIIRKYIETNNMLKGKDAKLNITTDDTLEGIIAAVSVKLPEPVFEGQHKQKLKSTTARTAVSQSINSFMTEWVAANPDKAKLIAQRAIISAKANLAAKASRDASRKKASDGFASLNTVSKLTKCSSNNPEECELFIVEG